MLLTVMESVRTGRPKRFHCGPHCVPENRILITQNSITLHKATKILYPANSTKRFSWLTRSTPIFIVEECSTIYFLCRAHSPEQITSQYGSAHFEVVLLSMDQQICRWKVVKGYGVFNDDRPACSAAENTVLLS